MILDMTTPQEYAAILERLPEEIRAIVKDDLPLLDEVIIDRYSLLSVRLADMRITYPLHIDDRTFDQIDALMQQGVPGGWRSDGRIGIPSTLHRLSRETNVSQLTSMITVRVGRALMGVAEPLRDVLYDAVTNEYGIAIIGPPAAGKTTLLRDIARILAERLGSGLVIIDTSNEIAGDSDHKHPIVGAARRVPVGNPLWQGEKFARAIGNMGPKALLSDEIGYRDDIPVIAMNAPRGVSVTATLHGKNMRRVAHSQNLWPILGIQNGVKTEPAVFKIAIEVPRRGFFRVHQDFDASLTCLLAGKEPTEGIRDIHA